MFMCFTSSACGLQGHGLAWPVWALCGYYALHQLDMHSADLCIAQMVQGADEHHVAAAQHADVIALENIENLKLIKAETAQNQSKRDMQNSMEVQNDNLKAPAPQK